MPNVRATYAGKRKLFQFRDSLESAIRSDLVEFQKGLLGAMGMNETPRLHQAASHLGLQHMGTHVNRMADESVGSEVHHVFNSPDAKNGVNNLMNQWRSQGMHPTYMGMNSQGYHVVGATDHLGRGTYAHIKQTPPVHVNIPQSASKTTIAVTQPAGSRNPFARLSGAVAHGIQGFKQGLEHSQADKNSVPEYPRDSGSNVHGLAANHGIAAYDTRGRWQANVSGAPGRTAHFSHLMTAAHPQASIQKLHASISQNHPTTDIKYNRVRVNGGIRHVYSFQHHDGKALHTVTVTRPATERPGGKIEWQ